MMHHIVEILDSYTYNGSVFEFTLGEYMDSGLPRLGETVWCDEITTGCVELARVSHEVIRVWKEISNDGKQYTAEVVIFDTERGKLLQYAIRLGVDIEWSFRKVGTMSENVVSDVEILSLDARLVRNRDQEQTHNK